jgi:hypothetical protein
MLQVTAILFYLFCEVFNKNKFVINFVVCVVLLALDFWTVSIGWLLRSTMSRPKHHSPAQQRTTHVSPRSMTQP